MEALTAAAAWASGLNPYLAVLVLGVLARTGVAPVPDVLASIPVMAVAGLLTVVHFVVDKVPLLDSASDVVHTAIRPVVAGVLAALLADHAEVANALGGAAIGLVAHLGKTSLRAVVNHSPEPASNIVTSVAEDVAVGGVLYLATQYPAAAAVAVAVLVVAAVAVTWLALRFVRGTWRRVAQRFRRTRDPAAAAPIGRPGAQP